MRARLLKGGEPLLQRRCAGPPQRRFILHRQDHRGYPGFFLGSWGVSPCGSLDQIAQLSGDTVAHHIGLAVVPAVRGNDHRRDLAGVDVLVEVVARARPGPQLRSGAGG
jgi:hypothetical protein